MIGETAGGGMKHNGAERTIADVDPAAPSGDPELVGAHRACRGCLM